MTQKSLTPHGPGFSFVDSCEIVEAGKKARGVKWLDPASPWFADHFPGDPLMPGVFLVECAAQVAGVLWQSHPGKGELWQSARIEKKPSPLQGQITLLRAKPSWEGWGRVIFLAQIQNFRFLKTVRPDQTLEVEVTLEKDFGTLAQFEAVLRVGRELVASGKLTMSRQKG